MYPPLDHDTPVAETGEVLSPSSWLSESDADALRSVGSRRSAPPGATLVSEGDEPHDVLLITQGRVKIVSTAPSGTEVVLAVVGAGAIVGELSAIDGAPHSASAVAVDDVEVVAVHGRAFLDFLDQNRSAMQALLRLTVGRLRHSSDRQLEFAAIDALGRVCRRLTELADDASGGGEATIQLGLTQHEFAQWCGLSREAVVKALRRLRDLGWISQSESTVTIHDPDALRSRGAG